MSLAYEKIKFVFKRITFVRKDAKQAHALYIIRIGFQNHPVS